MTNLKDSDYRTVPAFNKEFASLGEAVGFAIETFRNKVSQQFVIAAIYIQKKYFVMPFSQFRIVKPEHPIVNAHSLILFQGNLAQLREIAFSFPPDLLSSFPPPEPAPVPDAPGIDDQKTDPPSTSVPKPEPHQEFPS